MTDPNRPTEQPPPFGQQPGFGQPPAYGQTPVGEPAGFPPAYGQTPAGFGAPPPQQQYGYPPAPPAPPAPVGPGGLVLDPGSGVYIPQGTELASFGRRIGSYFLSILLVIVTLVIGYVIWGLLVWGKGTTPALQVLGMKVWRVDQPGVPDFGRMALREVVGRFLVEGFVPLAGLVSFVLFLATEKRQTLHDMIASTTVLYDPNKILG